MKYLKYLGPALILIGLALMLTSCGEPRSHIDELCENTIARARWDPLPPNEMKFVMENCQEKKD